MKPSDGVQLRECGKKNNGSNEQDTHPSSIPQDAIGAFWGIGWGVIGLKLDQQINGCKALCGFPSLCQPLRRFTLFGGISPPAGAFLFDVTLPVFTPRLQGSFL